MISLKQAILVTLFGLYEAVSCSPVGALRVSFFCLLLLTRSFRIIPLPSAAPLQADINSRVVLKPRQIYAQVNHGITAAILKETLVMIYQTQTNVPMVQMLVDVVGFPHK